MKRTLASRVAAMSGAEFSWRSRAAARVAWDRLHAAIQTPAWKRSAIVNVLAPGNLRDSVRAAADGSSWGTVHRLLGSALTAEPARFVIAPLMRETVSARIGRQFPTAAREAAARADRLLAGEYDLLGYRGLRFDRTGAAGPDWHLDPVHGRHAPLQFWSRVPYLDPKYGDHKIIWELNRQQDLLALGRAFWLTGDARYREAIGAGITSWVAANPPLTGINWASMLELGFRSLSWIWAAHFAAESAADDEQPWLVDLFVALDRQLGHVARNLSYYFSPNTHLLGEALALYVAGRSLPMLRCASRYADTGRRILIDEIDRQIGADGGHAERSTHYHRYTLDFYLLALAIARITGDADAPRFEAAVARLAFAARLLADGRGRLPHIGDDDGGMLLPIAGRAPDDVRDSLAAAAALVDRPDLRVGDTPEEAFWLLSHPSLFAQLEQSRAVAPIEGPASAALPDTGYYVSRSSGGDHLVMDAGMHGFLNGGHAHADALSLTFSLRGIPLLIDPGTGSYTTDVEARDRFRSSQLHNTVVVDGRSQSSSSGPFHWNTTANGAAEIWRTNPGFDYLEATHDGYAPLEHRRHLLAMHGDLLIVADAVCGTGAHEMQVHWHLDPRWTVQLAGRRATFRTAGERVDLAVSHGTLDRIAGSEDSPLGWHSPDYGRIEPTSTVTASVSGSLPLWVVSVFGLDPMNEVLVVEPLPVWAPAGSLVRAMAVRIARAHSVDIFAIGAAAAPAAVRTSGRTIWRAGGYETDARVLFCRAGEAASRIALVDGSLVRSSDRQALNVELPRETPDLHLDVPRPCGPETMAARVSGPAFGAQVQLAGTELPVAVERRSTARASASRVRRPTR